ncbi:hypothetical protein SLNWT_4986 [Streptomyces albus]|uniref:Secreted protein n=1 Tax=Streptomyces albus (strain ATCC 21838 / DSM 41398 / FERM P-419 / JCM 4703 / NBRC 107858) TaxID=1081613 RepID=A0A0B5F4V1_STRA4|nr:hypothetical protein SLNWT_4986 [Streptomyces albus]AOU79669.1 hypothetical protein SLNHY_4978 [Streptomyces albus]
MAYGRRGRPRLRLCGGALAGALLLLGCSGGGEDGAASPAATGRGGEKGGTGGSAAPEPSTTSTSPGTGTGPKDRGSALALARAVAAEPDAWGTGFVRSTAYEGDPDRTGELGRDCVWRQEPLPASELISLTRRSEVPARGGKGALRVAAVVTVHRDVDGASWEMARTLEEALRCPEQQLNATERVTGLISLGIPSGELGETAHDSLDERGMIRSTEGGGPYPYSWVQARWGAVTMAAVAKGAKGHGQSEVDDAVEHAVASMLELTERRLEAGDE